MELKKIDCCWYCIHNAKCGSVFGDGNPVCLCERPMLRECIHCDIYNNYSPCPDFVPRNDEEE
jgi:hypothetical protein